MSLKSSVNHSAIWKAKAPFAATWHFSFLEWN
jgi:hypothetical protein